MSQDEFLVISGELVEDEHFLTFEELCRACAAEQDSLIELIAHGLLQAAAPESARFGGMALRRARAALRLQRDLGVNAAGAVLAVELLERIDALHQKLRIG